MPPQVLAAVADGVQREMGELLAAVMAPASGLHAFDFLGGSLMPEVEAAISKAMPGNAAAILHPGRLCNRCGGSQLCCCGTAADIIDGRGTPQSHTTRVSNPMCATVQAGHVTAWASAWHTGVGSISVVATGGCHCSLLF